MTLTCHLCMKHNVEYVKVKLSLYFIKYDAVKCIGSGVTAPYILNQNTS